METTLPCLKHQKKDLEANPEMAKDILTIMNDAAQAGNIPGTQHVQQTTISTSTESTDSYVPSPPPAPTPAAHAPAPPPPPMAKGPTPPPPPPSGGGPKPPPAPMAPSSHAAAAPPAPSAPVSGGGGGGSIFDQIRQGGIKLKKAEIAEVEKGTASTGNPLADTLINAMSKYRADITGNDKADDEDDWSE